MDQDNNEREPPKRGRGRPRKQVHTKAGRPFKTGAARRDPPQRRRPWAPRSKTVLPPTTMATRLRAGKIEPRDYRDRPRRRPRRRRDEADNDSDGEDDEDNEDEDEGEGHRDDDGDVLMGDVDRPLDDQFFYDELMRGTEPPADDELSSNGDEPAVKIKSEHGPRGRPSLQPRRHGGGAITISSDPDSDSDDEMSTDLDSLVESIIRPRGKRATGSTPAASSHRRDAARPMPSAEDEFMAVQRDIRQLFPIPHSYLVGLRGSYWDADVEKAFRRLWARDDHGDRLAQGQRATSDEVQLWKIMLAEFYRIPPHLFTYGLKLGEDCYEAPESLMLTSKASRALQRILIHPVWNGELDSLRYTLQMAVLASAREHSEPFGPLPNSMVTIVEDLMLARLTGTDRDRAAGQIQYNMWTRGKADYTGHSVETLIRMLNGRIRPNRHAGQAEKSLFILTTGVMEDLLGVLDQFDRDKFTLTADEQVAEFRRFWAGVIDEMQPRDGAALRDLKWELELCELRDAEIRKAMRRLAHDDKFLYDVAHIGTSHCDRVPLYEHHIEMDRRAIPVLRGEAIDPKRAVLDGLDKLDKSRARALDRFTSTLMNMVLSKDKPTNAQEKGKEAVRPVPCKLRAISAHPGRATVRDDYLPRVRGSILKDLSPYWKYARIAGTTMPVPQSNDRSIQTQEFQRFSVDAISNGISPIPEGPHVTCPVKDVTRIGEDKEM
ncbi:hypothetical protein F5X98DRAFT_389212 [Xylaria grammica]|nr:hypothetical protein F5X98DRAFT_389212 [Xylaria grammica]